MPKGNNTADATSRKEIKIFQWELPKSDNRGSAIDNKG